MYLAYSVLLGLGLILAAPYFLWKGRGTGKYLQNLNERILGTEHRAFRPGGVWVHAVSVGEVLTARPLVKELRWRYPGVPVFLSTTTTTGQELARSRFLGVVDGCFYMPFDFAFSVRRVLRRLQPQLVLLVETEIWPNLLREARAAGASVAIVNGRLSPGSFRNYRRVRSMLAPVLANVNLFLMQGEAHAQRIKALGAVARNVHVFGNLKYDAVEAQPTPPELQRLLAPEGAGPLWIAGSTVEGEEELVLDAFVTVLAAVPNARLLIAPRRPERFAEAAAAVARRGLSGVRRSFLPGPASQDAVIILDTLGELPAVYPLATVVFVGGSLVDRGGHNILEPAIAGKVVVVGPHMSNFAEIEAAFTEEKAFVRVGTPAALAAVVIRALTDPAWCAEIGARASQAAQHQKGAAALTVEALEPLLH